MGLAPFLLLLSQVIPLGPVFFFVDFAFLHATTEHSFAHSLSRLFVLLAFLEKSTQSGAEFAVILAIAKAFMSCGF